MAVTTGPRFGLTRWSAGTDPVRRAQFDADHALLEAQAAMYVHGLFNARPAAGVPGRFHYATDTGALSYDTGSAWTPGVVLTNDPRLTDARTPTPHTHTAAEVTAGVLATARLGTGSASSTTWLRGDGTWQALPTAVTTLAGLSDTTITSPATGHFLRYNAGTGKWENVAPTKAMVGLDQVDNTSDAAKPLSTAAVSALAAKVETSRTITAGTGLTGGGDLTANRTLAVDFAASGASSTTQAVRADDSRLANARAPLAHSHSAADTNSGTFDLARLPVAASGTSSSTQVVRADDSRLANARTPLAHTHPVSDVTGLQAALDGKAATVHTHTTAQVTGLDAALADRYTEAEADARFQALGTADTAVNKVRAAELETHTRGLTFTYNPDGSLATIVDKAGATTVVTVTLGYTDGDVTSVAETAAGTTATTTLTYDGVGVLTSTSRSVA